MKYFKVSLFAFICAIIFALTAYALNVMPIFMLSILALMVCIVTLLIWLCISNFHRFRYSLTIISIIIFFTVAVISYILCPQTPYVEALTDILNLPYISLVFIVTSLACCISILTLIAQLIFGRNGTNMSNVATPICQASEDAANDSADNQ